MDQLIFDFSDYKAYLRHRLGDYRQRRGMRTALAKALGCQPTFVTQVLNGEFHFSLEQAEKINRFLEHTEEEGEYLFLLIQRERAGTRELIAHFQKKLERLLAQRRVLINRIGREIELSTADQAVYYTSWHYAALHMATGIPELQAREKLAAFFHLPLERVTEILSYLTASGLVNLEHGRYKIGSTRIRLSGDSPQIVRHITNWRVAAIESLERHEPSDLHYSGVITLSHADKVKVKDRIMEALNDSLKITKESPEQDICCLNLDLFGLKR